jgi:hypothetical protein
MITDLSGNCLALRASACNHADVSALRGKCQRYRAAKTPTAASDKAGTTSETRPSPHLKSEYLPKLCSSLDFRLMPQRRFLLRALPSTSRVYESNSRILFRVVVNIAPVTPSSTRWS